MLSLGVQHLRQATEPLGVLLLGSGSTSDSYLAACLASQTALHPPGERRAPIMPWKHPQRRHDANPPRSAMGFREFGILLGNATLNPPRTPARLRVDALMPGKADAHGQGMDRSAVFLVRGALSHPGDPLGSNQPCPGKRYWMEGGGGGRVPRLLLPSASRPLMCRSGCSGSPRRRGCLLFLSFFVWVLLGRTIFD